MEGFTSEPFPVYPDLIVVVLSIYIRRELSVYDGWPQWRVKIHRRELARIVYSKQWKSSSNFKAVFWTKKCFEVIPSRPEFSCKFAGWFSSVFQLLQMHYHVFRNLANSSRVKTNQEIMIFMTKKKLHTCTYSGPGIFLKTKETLVI